MLIIVCLFYDVIVHIACNVNAIIHNLYIQVKSNDSIHAIIESVWSKVDCKKLGT